MVDKIQLCRDRVRKVKMKLELNLARDTNNKRRASTDMLARKGRSKKGATPSRSKAGKPVTRNEEEAEQLFHLSLHL